MTDYSKMSDQEINMLVAKIQHTDKNFIESKTRPPSVVLLNHINNWVDYCNNPADAWPIILEHGISIISAKGEFICVPSNSIIDGWTGDNAETIYSSSGVIHKNPLRAAMIVFLSM